MKYRIGDVIVLKAKLSHGEYYGNSKFSVMKYEDCNYGRITNFLYLYDEVKSYIVNGWYISDEMINHEATALANKSTIDLFDGEYSFLSNFYNPCEVKFEGLMYKNSESAYQSAKTTQRTLRLDFTETNGYEAKKLGRKLSIREDWDTVKLDIMLEIVRDKFSRNKELQIKLLRTGCAELVEGNYWNDTFWGMCNEEGNNHLGRILMTVRDELKRRG